MSQLKETLEECKKGIELLRARVKTNGALVEDRNTRYKAWEARRDAANNKWNEENTNRQNAQRDWDNRKNEIRNHLLAEDKWMGCGGCGTNRGCDGGYQFNRNEMCGGLCQSVCRRNWDTAERDADNWIRGERGHRPGNYNEPKFSEGAPDPAQLDTTPITVGCCANQTNVIGSELTDSTITQNNNCLSSLQSKYDKAEEDAAKKKKEEDAAKKKAEEDAAKNKAEEDAAKNKAPSPTPAPVSASVSASASAPAQNTMIIGFGLTSIFGVIFLCICFLSVIFLMMEE